MCVCLRVIENVCICAHLSLRPCTLTSCCVCEHFTVILPVCTWIKTTRVIFAQRRWSMQHSWAANEETALVTGQLCVYFSPPVLSWGRCHASSLIDSQICMSLYDTPGSCGCDEHQHSHWFCRSTSIELRVQPSSQHMYLCAQLLYTEQRSYRKFNAQKSRILAGDGDGKSPLTFF